MVTLLQFAAANPPYCWVSCSKKLFPKHSGFHIFISLLRLVIPHVGSLMRNVLGILWMGHSGYSSKGCFAPDPKVQFCLHNILRDCEDCAVWLSWCCCVFQVFRFIIEDEICTSSNWMFLLCCERESYFCELLLFATVNQEEMNCSYLSCVFSLSWKNTCTIYC